MKFDKFQNGLEVKAYLCIRLWRLLCKKIVQCLKKSQKPKRPRHQSSRQWRRDSRLAHRPLPTRSNSPTFGPNFLHQSQQRPNSRQPKNCQRHYSRTHNKTRTTRHRSKSHYHYSSDLVHLFQT